MQVGTRIPASHHPSSLKKKGPLPALKYPSLWIHRRGIAARDGQRKHVFTANRAPTNA